MDLKKKNLLVAFILIIFSSLSFGLIKDRIQIEFKLTGNSITTNNMDFFYQSETDYLEFVFDSGYQNKTQEGAFKPQKFLKGAAGILKYRISSSLSLSLGINLILANNYQDILVEYSSPQSWRSIRDELKYNGFGTEIRAFIPTLGIHYNLKLSGRFGLEVSLAVGPNFSKVKYNRDLQEEMISEQNTDLSYYSSQRIITMNGSAIGLSTEGMVKIKYSLNSRVGFFMEMGYCLRELSEISGRGTDYNGNDQKSWENPWFVIDETMRNNQGETADLYYPSNNPELLTSKSDDFELNLSGLTLSVGVFFNL